MTLQTGSRLGHYEILDPLGAGGIEFLIRVNLFLEKSSGLVLKM
jgi:hypothetical protein